MCFGACDIERTSRSIHIINKLKYSSRVFHTSKPIYHQKHSSLVMNFLLVYNDYCYFTSICWGTRCVCITNRSASRAGFDPFFFLSQKHHITSEISILMLFTLPISVYLSAEFMMFSSQIIISRVYTM